MMNANAVALVLALSSLVGVTSFAYLLVALTHVVRKRAEHVHELEVGKAGSRLHLRVKLSKLKSGDEAQVARAKAPEDRD